MGGTEDGVTSFDASILEPKPACAQSRFGEVAQT
jgi:hypothetical protein